MTIVDQEAKLRAFAPVLLLIYVDVLLGHAIMAAGRAWGMAIAKYWRRANAC